MTTEKYILRSTGAQTAVALAFPGGSIDVATFHSFARAEHYRALLCLLDECSELSESECLDRLITMNEQANLLNSAQTIPL